MTDCELVWWKQSRSWTKVKVVKWCQKRWNWPILMYIYHKQCEIIQKIQWKGSNSQLQCFYNGRSLTDRSSLLKTRKTRETKTWITQNFELVWPIQGRTMWKSTSRGFQKCGSFRDLEVLNHSYRLSKSGQIQTWEGGVAKKDTATILSFGLWYGISVGPTWLVPRWFNGSAQNSLLWPCLFFATPLIFGNGLKISQSSDFEQP